jgi:hypothetical protein
MWLQSSFSYTSSNLKRYKTTKLKGMEIEKYINANKIPPKPPLPIIIPPVKTLIHKQEIKNIKENITKINIVLFLFDTL